MSIWRAPLLILGIVLILLAAGAIAAPWLVDFNRYKPQLERLGTQLAGRKVRIAGDVELVLFPWPAARLRDVRVAGDAEGRFRELLRVEEVQARLSLPALLAARLEVERIVLRRPVLALEHAGGGRGNWQLRGGAVAALPLAPERVMLDAIIVEDGRLLLADRRMRGTLTISRINARLRAPRATGPWRMRGSWRLLGRAWNVRLSTGVWRKGEPLSVSLRMEPPAARAGYVVRLDGRLHGANSGNGEVPRFEGQLVALPVVPQGRSDPLDPARQVELAARVSLTPEAVELTDMKLTPRFAAASPFDTVRGQARLEFGAVLGARVSLSTPKLLVNRRLERLLGEVDGAAASGDVREADGLTLLRRHLLALAARLTQLPPDMLLEVDLQAASVQVREHALSGVVLSAEASPELLAIHHLRADVPGRGALSFRGNLLAGDMLQLTGELDVRSDDARTLLFAASPMARRLLAPVWRGKPGRVELLATVDLTDYALRLVSRKLTLDGADLALDWRLHEPDKGGTGRESIVRVRLGELDVGSYLRPASRLAALADVVRDRAKAGADRLQLEISAARLKLADLVWRGVELALRHEGGGVFLRRLKVADVDGLRLDASGEFRRAGQSAWQGSLRAAVKGERAAALWLLARRLAGAGRMPAWLRRLGAVDLSLQMDMGEKGGNRHADASLAGRAGPLEVSASARGELPAAAHADWRRATWQVRAEVAGERAAPLLALAGLEMELPEGRTRLALEASGVPVSGMKGQATVRLPGTVMKANGSLRLPQEADAPLFPQGEMRLSVALDDVASWARLAGVALWRAGGALEGTLRAALAPGRLRLSDMALRAGGNTLSGNLLLSWPLRELPGGPEEAAPKLSGELVAGRLDAGTVLVALLGDADNPLRLRQRMAGGWALNVDLRGDELLLPWQGVSLPDARLRLVRENGEALQVELRAGDARMEARLRRVDLGLDVEGVLQAGLPLKHVMRSSDGRVWLDGSGQLSLNFKGRPATLKGMVLALKGGGRLVIEQGRLHGLAPQRLMQAVRGIDTEKEVERFDELARKALLQGNWKLPEKLAAGLLLSDGLLDMMPVEVRGEEVRGRISGLLDVTARKLDITLEFAAADEREGMPPFSVSLAGEPGRLAVSPELEALRDWAQQRVIRRKEEELKRLEEQQRRLREQARKLEEKARLEEQRRRQERLRQEADRLHERLQEVLAGAYRQMQAPPDRGEAAKSAAAAGDRQDALRSIDELLRQLREDSNGDTSENEGASVRPLPRAAARPSANVPHPRRRPRQMHLRGDEGEKTPATGKDDRAAAASAGRSTRQRTETKHGGAAVSREGGKRRIPQRQTLRPLTNWNRLAPPMTGTR